MSEVLLTVNGVDIHKWDRLECNDADSWGWYGHFTIENEGDATYAVDLIRKWHIYRIVRGKYDVILDSANIMPV